VRRLREPTGEKQPGHWQRTVSQGDTWWAKWLPGRSKKSTSKRPTIEGNENYTKDLSQRSKQLGPVTPFTGEEKNASALKMLKVL